MTNTTTAMPGAAPAAPLLKTNLDTDLLKLIAIVSMLIDHVGSAFFPEATWMRCVGRLAFPIFCYCMTVGLLYTHNVKRYLLRLGIFAVVSQPFYILAFHPHDFWENITVWNIFFTLFLSLLAMYGIQSKKWWWFVLGLLVILVWNFDYSTRGIVLMLLFYLCRNRPALGVLLYAAIYVPSLFFGVHADSPFAVTLGSFVFDAAVFALLAAPLIFCPTRVNLRIPKWFFYAFYPAHLAVIGLLRIL